MVLIQKIDIYETYNAGGVVEVSALDGANQQQVLWSVPNPTRITTSRIFSPPLSVSIFFLLENILIEIRSALSGGSRISHVGRQLPTRLRLEIFEMSKRKNWDP